MSLTRILILFVCLSFCVVLFTAGCSCGDDDDDNDSGNDDDTSDDDNVTDDDSGDDDSGDDDAADDDVADDDSGDDDSDDDDVTDDDTVELLSIDFEDYSLGDLPSPWVVEDAGASYFEVVDSTTKTGRMLWVAGGDQVGDYAYATYPVTHNNDRVVLEFDVSVNAPGDANIHLYQDNTTGLAVFSMIGETQEIILDYMTDHRDCGVWTSQTWYTVRLDLDFSTNTVDVYVGGVITDCVDVPLNPNLTYDHLGQFSVSDYGGAGEGGAPKFDNIRVYEWN